MFDSGGSANGDRSGGSIGEYTAVASAKRGVLGPGTLRESVEESEETLADVPVLIKGGGLLFCVMVDMVVYGKDVYQSMQ
jgi:hypothetical protein